VGAVMETPDFKKIFNDLSEGDHIFEMRDVNLQQLASHLEELYLLNQELQERIEALEKSKTDVYNDFARSVKQAAREVFGKND
jgi:hypothetical protein